MYVFKVHGSRVSKYTNKYTKQNRVNLVINNGALYDFAPLSPGVCIVQGTIDSWPTKADAMTSGVNAGSFKSEGGLIPQTIRCASIYDTPDPSVKIVLFVKVPFAGSNMVKVRLMRNGEN